MKIKKYDYSKRRIIYAYNYRKKHPEKIKAIQKKWYQNNKEHAKKYSRLYDKTIKGKFQQYKSRARRLKRDFTLNYKQFEKIFSKVCFYCGSSIKIGIDRKDSLKGYTLENSTPCCFPCNRLKGKAGSKNFINICIAVAKYARVGI